MTNFKPATNFDAKYNTKLNQVYDFKNGMTSDEIWALCKNIFDTVHNNDDIFIVDYGVLKPVLDNMHITFPYANLSGLSDMDKLYLLSGMASEFNYHDIIHFCINEESWFSNTEQIRLETEYNLEFYWVLSPYSIEIVKKHFNIK